MLKLMKKDTKHRVSCKIWLEHKGKPLLGRGGAKILMTIGQLESISKTAIKTKMSYRYVWNYLSKLEKRLGEPVVKTFKGGSKGGGGAILTKLGKELLNEYNRVEHQLKKIVDDKTFYEKKDLKINGDNSKIEGIIQRIEKDSNSFYIKIKSNKLNNFSVIISEEVNNKLSISIGDIVEVFITSPEKI